MGLFSHAKFEYYLTQIEGDSGGEYGMLPVLLRLGVAYGF